MSESINNPELLSPNRRERHNRLRWDLPLTLALAVHLAIFGLLIMPPSFLMHRRDFQTIQTINLFTPEQYKHDRVQKPKPVKTHRKSHPPKTVKPPKKPSPQAKSINIDDQPAPLPKPEKIISLRPRRVKKRPKKQVKPKPDNNDLLRQALERTRARINEQKEARQVKKALADLVNNLHTTPVRKPTPPPEPPDTGVQTKNTAANARRATAPGSSQKGDNQVADRAMRQYYMAISRRIHDNWSLPETQSWSPSLEAVIVIVVHRNGQVSKTFFEKKSPNIYFNQYVEKTINNSIPMPAFPADIKKDRLEIGLKFRPSGMF